MKKLIIIPLLLFSLILSGETYYVSSSDGNDDDSGLTEVLAWATITKVNALTPSAGDSILFKCGDSWREQLAFISKSGSSGNEIYIGSYGAGAKPILYGSIDGDVVAYWTDLGSNIWATPNSSFTQPVLAIWYNTNTTTGYGNRETSEGGLNTNWDFWYDATNDRVKLYHSGGSPDTQADGLEISGVFNVGANRPIIYFSNSDYCIVDGLNLKYANYHGVSNYSSDYLTVKNCLISYTYGKGIWFDEADYCMADHDTLTRIGYSTMDASPILYGEGIYGGTCSYSVIRYCQLSYFWNNGFDFNIGESDTIRNCKVFNYINTGIGQGGIYLDAVNNSTVYENICDSVSIGFAINAELAESTANNNIIRNNISSDCEIGFWVYCNDLISTQINNNKIYNNIAYCDEDEIAVWIRYSTGTTLRNNIWYDSSGNNRVYVLFNSDALNVSTDYNCFYMPGSATIWKSAVYSSLADYVVASGLDAHSIDDDPLLTTPGSDYTLQVTSPCIDAGIYVGFPFQGSSPDMGYIEYEDPPEYNEQVFGKSGAKFGKHNGKLVKINR